MIKNNDSRQIIVSEMAPHVHSFGLNENKVDKIFSWLQLWIEQALKDKKIKYGDRLPLKGDLAFHIGVSVGTIQSVFRRLEDVGLVESKQRIGTFISSNDLKNINPKMTSRKDYAEELIKIFIKNNYQIGEKLFSTRKLANILDLSDSTVRFALKNLKRQGVLIQKDKIYFVESLNFEIKQIEIKSLAEKISEKIEKYILDNNIKNRKILSNKELSIKYNVSIKTIHDALKLLSKKGIIYTRRGNYGTLAVEKDNQQKLYFYEEIELKIKQYIIKNCEIGDKLPTIENFSIEYKVSTKTIKRALENLLEDGYITFTRGRNGGTYVTDIPQASKENYKWLVLNTGYVINKDI